MGAEYIAMTLEVEGKLTPIWQKIETGLVEVVRTQIVSYVDIDDQPVNLPDTYEMTVATGETLVAPGGK